MFSGFFQRWDCLQYQRNVTEVGIQILRYLSARLVVKWFLTWCFANELCSWAVVKQLCVSLQYWNDDYYSIMFIILLLLWLLYYYVYCTIATFTEIQEHFAIHYIAGKGAGMPQLFIVWSVSSHIPVHTVIHVFQVDLMGLIYSALPNVIILIRDVKQNEVM